MTPVERRRRRDDLLLERGAQRAAGDVSAIVTRTCRVLDARTSRTMSSSVDGLVQLRIDDADLERLQDRVASGGIRRVSVRHASLTCVVRTPSDESARASRARRRVSRRGRAGELRAQGGRRGSGEPRTRDEVERRRAEGRILEQLDRVAALAHEQLGCGDVDRARGLERADPVDASGRQVAERQRERSHHPQRARPRRPSPTHSRDAGVVVPSNERISIGSFGAAAPSGAPSSNAPSPRVRRPFLARPEVVDVAECRRRAWTVLPRRRARARRKGCRVSRSPSRRSGRRRRGAARRRRTRARRAPPR